MGTARPDKTAMNGQELVRRYRAGERDSSQVDLRRVNLSGAECTRANLREAKLYEAVVVDGHLGQAHHAGCASWERLSPGGVTYPSVVLFAV
jgi:uncharacterized protein YjbI with pentapeptide repeats